MTYNKITFPNKIPGSNPETTHNKELWFSDVNELKNNFNLLIDKLVEKDLKTASLLNQFLRKKQPEGNGSRFFIIDNFGNVIVSSVDISGKRDRYDPFVVIDDDGNDQFDVDLNQTYPIATNPIGTIRYSDEGENYGYLYLRKTATKWVRFMTEKVAQSLYVTKNEPAYFKTIKIDNAIGTINLDLSLAVRFEVHFIGSGNITFSKLAEYQAKKTQSIVISSDDPNFMTSLPLGVYPEETEGDDLTFDLPTTKNYVLLDVLDATDILKPELLWANRVRKKRI